MDRISRGWALTQQSWKVLKSDRSLVVFPILSIVFGILATVAIFTPAVITRGVPDNHDPVFDIAFLATAYVSTFIATFFNVALAACAARSMRGEDTKVGEGIEAAMQRLGPILGWTLLATTVGLLLNAARASEKRLPLVGEIAVGIAVWLAGAAWAIATYFVVPVLAFEGSGPLQSLKRSAAVVKARWGESATGAATITVATFVVSILIAVVGVVGAVVLFGAGLQVLGGAVVAITIAGILVVSFISSALSQIFRVAVYQYAVTGEAAGGFDGRSLQAAFEGSAGQNFSDPVTGRPL